MSQREIAAAMYFTYVGYGCHIKKKEEEELRL